MPNRTKWTPKKRAQFLTLLAEDPNVSRAAEEIGVARSWLYQQRNTDPAFAAAWDEAVEHAVETLESEVRRRALGWDEDVFNKDGEHTGARRVYSDNLAMFLLKAHRPDRYRDRSTTEHTGPNGQPLEIVITRRVIGHADEP
ncbi:MAG TPA: hypothetical protein VHN99_00665 [Deinococcales bacterium]|nr:hypothetical protein [Deinococcales bacterium]